MGICCIKVFKSWIFLVNAFRIIRKRLPMLIRERMSHPVITIHAESSMKEAQDLMQKEQIRHLPVVNKRGQPVGIITETDLAKASPSEATTLSVWEIRELVDKVK